MYILIMYIRVHAIPGAKKETVTKEDDDVLYISVKEPAEQNLANKRIREILAENIGVSVAQVRLLTGHHSRSKLYSVETK